MAKPKHNPAQANAGRKQSAGQRPGEKSKPASNGRQHAGQTPGAKQKPAANRKQAKGKMPVPTPRKDENRKQNADHRPKEIRADSAALLRRALIALLCAGMAFGTLLAAFSVRGELLQRKLPFVFGGQMQRTCIFDLDLGEEELRLRMQNTKRHGQTTAFTYFCNDELYLPSAYEGGVIMFGSPADNDCVLILTIVDDEGTVVYRSDGVAPGKYITSINPAISRENGSRACRVYVTGYEMTKHGYVCIGTQYSRLTVQIGGAQ